MGNETQGKRFEATGPNQGRSVFGTSGFYTNARLLVYGVNVHGNECGVYGQCVRGGSGLREPDVTGVGVYGFGESFGVFGNGNRGIAGVFGQNNRGRVGVLGASMRSGTGVVGVSMNALPSPLAFGESIPPPKDGNGGSGIGVYGSSGTGSGVFGVSDKGIGVEGRSGEVAGVYGTSISGSGGEFISDKKTGVFGYSDSGMGVEGRSKTGRGAMFESGKNVAQMRLLPQMQRTRFPKLPKAGKVGDLILTRYRTTRIGDELLADTCSLWLCVPKDSSSDDSDQWREVMLGPLVTGTL